MNLALNTKIIEPENKNEIDNAIILLHGYGGDGQDISTLALSWKRFLTKTVFLCPDAKVTNPDSVMMAVGAVSRSSPGSRETTHAPAAS